MIFYLFCSNVINNFATVIQATSLIVEVKVKNQVIVKEDYDDEPVYYCKRCLSLNIRQVPLMENLDYCGECGSTEIETTSIEEWKALYKEKYGRDFIVKRELKWPYWC